MIPIQLRLGGIYSYRQTATIDFGPLLDAHLFGIFGSVGSGKSSILEAITFALYGKVERINQADGMADNIINLEASRAEIDFRFASVIDGQEYLAQVRGRRTKTATLKRAFFRLDGEEWMPIEEEALVAAVGLSYDHFTRTVIIPQGKFQTFLLLKDSERTAMLQQLFRLERFDLADRLGRLKTQAEMQSQHLKGSIEVLASRPEQQEEEWLAQFQHHEQEERRLSARGQQLRQLLETGKRWQQAEEEGRQLEQLLVGIRQEITAGEAALEEHARQFQPLEAAWQQLPRLRELLRWAGVAIEARQAKALVREMEGRKVATQEAMVPLDHARQVAAGRLADCRKTWDALQATQAEPTLIQSRLALSQRLPLVEARLEQLTQQGRQIKGEKQKQEDELKQQITTKAGEGGLALPAEGDWPALLERHLTRLQEEIRSGEQALETWQQRSGLDLLAATLREEEPCPLCGATHHPHRHEPAAVREGLADAQAALSRVRMQHQRTQSALEQLNALQQHVARFDLELQRLRADFRKEEQKRQEDIALLQTWQTDQKGNQAWLDEQARISSELKHWQAQLRDSQVEAEKAEKAQQQGLDELRKQDSAISEQQVRCTTLERQIPEEQAQAWLDYSIESLSTILSETRTAIEDTEARYEQLRQTRDTLNQQQQKRIITRQHHEERLATLIRTRDEAHALLITPETGEAPDSAKLLAVLAQWQAEWAQLEQDIPRHQAEMKYLQKALQDEAENKAQRRKLQAELENVRKRLDNIGTLDRLFRGKGMVEYAAARYLRQIIRHANQRFHRMTRQKLQLELDGNKRILVRDFYHGGALRHVKTLSGGQLFQASLALALSLAEHIRQYREGQRDFFFLDEGFGTQDRESLQIVLDTLKALRTEGRSVGIISHVEELKQEVGAYLQVHLDPLEGSQVKPNY